MCETVLFTGVAGFIGSHVAEHCLKLGMRVVGPDDLSGGFVENVPEGVTFVEGSIIDAAGRSAIRRALVRVGVPLGGIRCGRLESPHPPV
jgi:nucleoside-diphosphate-sugar epimerase